ncbi:uncharacterized protein N7525_011564 [Penicillium rubens]|uniref:uncharacterized protein n=1 Tax=Penicillium rubens TaxID=1108849 RepID=UPI002A5A18DE|nr:uncharacterized protein N7525_011564 [Penicillium rubens]KAJ5822280.1 hypothetical protein N7525_011564 [Penicillium rubens]KAJ5859918.1 hypothetical protein N7534_005195 [Penicillium rubens]
MDPRFSHIFGTQTLAYWAKDTVETNYATLLGQQQFPRSHANRRMARKKHKRPRHEPSRPEQGPSQEQSVAATINMTPRDFKVGTYI